MGEFTIIIQWRTGYDSVKNNLTWPELMTCLQDIYDTAGQDLVKTILIVPVGHMFDLGPDFEFDLDGKVMIKHKELEKELKELKNNAA